MNALNWQPYTEKIPVKKWPVYSLDMSGRPGIHWAGARQVAADRSAVFSNGILNLW